MCSEDLTNSVTNIFHPNLNLRWSNHLVKHIALALAALFAQVELEDNGVNVMSSL